MNNQGHREEPRQFLRRPQEARPGQHFDALARKPSNQEAPMVVATPAPCQCSGPGGTMGRRTRGLAPQMIEIQAFLSSELRYMQDLQASIQKVIGSSYKVSMELRQLHDLQQSLEQGYQRRSFNWKEMIAEMRSTLTSEQRCLHSVLDTLNETFERSGALASHTQQVVKGKLTLIDLYLQRELILLCRRYSKCMKELMRAKARLFSFRKRKFNKIEGPAPTTKTTRSIRSYYKQD